MKDLLLSVAIGDICGSIYELRGYGTKNYDEVQLLRDDTDYTDDTICTFACAEALYKGIDVGKNLWERCQPEIQRGFGNRFRAWLLDENRTPYVSQGTNGSAMRCSGAAFLARNEQECKEMVFRICEPTHNHPDSIRGAEAAALAIFHLLHGKDKEFVRRNILDVYYPEWSNLAYKDIIPDYQFSCLCKDTVPLAMIGFLESKNFEDCLKLCIATMGDADTMAAIAAPMAYITYGELPEHLVALAKSKLPEWMLELNERINNMLNR